MAFSQGTVSSEGGSIKRYVGVASVYVLGVNPTKAELEKFYGRTIENDPEYLGEAEVGDKKVPQIRLDFIVKADPKKYLDSENNPLDFVNRVSFFLRRAYRYNKDNTKVQVIDKYGRTAWVTVEQAKNHEIPVYKNGPANIDASYRPAYIGEEDLTNFLIAFIGIPSTRKKVGEQWVNKVGDELKDCEARLDHIENYFKGDISEIKRNLTFQPKNKVKVLFGVRTADDNKQYQNVFTRMFLKNGVSDYTKLSEEVRQAKEAGAYPTTEFDCTEIHEYVVESTNFVAPSTDGDPFDSDASSPWGGL